MPGDFLNHDGQWGANWNTVSKGQEWGEMPYTVQARLTKRYLSSAKGQYHCYWETIGYHDQEICNLDKTNWN